MLLSQRMITVYLSKGQSKMTWYGKLAPYNKLVEGVLGQVTSLGSAFLTINGSIPPSIGVPVATAFAAVGVFRIWYIKNEPLVEEVVNAAEDIYENVSHTVHPDAPAPGPLPGPIPVTTIVPSVLAPSYPIYSVNNELPTAALVLPASPDDPGRHTA